ncbi:MAG: polysaccharide pyruvyl transferase family protein [Bacilli bacterium]|nr:polysaccharide pyruvyl transferase family protein [Bacilli bacterium]
MKIFLNAYIQKNLGDDLFVKIITERYKNHEFIVPDKAKYLVEDNFSFYQQNDKINNIIKAFTLGRVSIQNKTMKKADYSVSIGGSMYIERNYKGLKKIIYSLLYVPKYDFIIGANFGPYKTTRFFRKYHNAFQKAKDVCLRDKYSYDLFKDIKHCRYAPDIIFSLDTSKFINKKSKRVIISVIDCTKRFQDTISKKYFTKIVEIINYYRKAGYKVCLMSFCKLEGDEEAIKKVLDMLDNKNNIETYFYDGNIDEALNKIGDSSIIVGTRFHANIIGLVFGKKVIPISYSDKTLNVLNDINYGNPIIDINNIDSFDISDLDLKYKNSNLDIYQIKQQSLKHFCNLDNLLLKEGDNIE